MSAVRRECDRACGPARSYFSFYKPVVGVFLAAGLSAIGGHSLAAPPPDLSDEIVAHIEAGDFAPALEKALAAKSPQRDRLLALVAVAQAEAGQREEFADTLNEIGDELQRMQAARDGRVEILAQVFQPNGPGAFQAPGGNQQGLPGANGNNNNVNPFGPGAAGGGQQADFEPLLELLTQTIAPTTWEDVGGPGSVRPFPSGVLVDINGLMRRLQRREMAESGAALARAKKLAAEAPQAPAGSPRRNSPLRMVSLPRLEKHLVHELAAGHALDEAVLVLAGLARVEYVLIYPESGEVILAGPAGDWRNDACGRLVSTATGRPVVRLDDLATVLREVALDGGAFGCSIVPRRSGLASAQEYANETGKSPIKPKDRDGWLEGLRSRLGRQDIEFYGLSTASHAARVLIEADYHMKLVGIDLAEGTPAVPSYIDLVEKSGKPPASLDVLRWWFTLNYDAIVASDDELAFQLKGPAVQVLSESELLAADGRRIHTGQSEPLNREFARSFTADFAALSAKYPVYAELANVFDLAVAAAVIRNAKALDKVNWQLGCLGDDEVMPIPRTFVPREVDTVATCRVLDKRRIVAVVSGGVRVDPDATIDELGFSEDGQGRVAEVRAAAQPHEAANAAWWWDADPARLAAQR